MSRAGSHGSALVVAIALLVVLAGIGVGVTRLVVVEAQRSTLGVQQLRLEQAARLGQDLAVILQCIEQAGACERLDAATQALAE